MNNITKYCEIIEGAAKYSNRQIKIVFPFDFKEIDRIKTLLSRRFVPEGKYWTCPLSIPNVKKLQEWGYPLSPELQSMLLFNDVVSTSKSELKHIAIKGLKHDLFKFQNLGVSFIESKGGRALIADEMGLGKTMQAIGWLQLHLEFRPAIIVVPASLKQNWEREILKWMPSPSVQILSGTTPYRTYAEILIINYDILSHWIPTLRLKLPKVLIMDEIHSIKNSHAKRTKAVKQLAKGIEHVIGLSGTPIVNRPIEIYNALTIINSMVIPNFKQYVSRFCAPKYNGFGWDYSGATNTDELHRMLTDTFMIRRKKSDVLKDLPDKLKAFIPMELANQEEYNSAEKNFIGYIREKKGAAAAIKASNAETLVMIEGLKQIAVQGKMNQVIEWIEDFLESDNKLVVFAVHKSAIDVLMNRFGKIAVKVDGSVSMTERQHAVDSFQNDPNVQLFIGNIQAAGQGITLTASSNVAFIELPWTPGALVQAEDRVHRIGQKDSVTIHYLLAVNTIEEKIANLLDSKRMVLDAVLDGEKTEEKHLLTELINSYTEIDFLTKTAKELRKEMEAQGNVTFGKKYDYLK